MDSAVELHNGTGWRVLIVGTGGQGVLTLARSLCNALVEYGHSVVSGQLHGMAQRGGSVQSAIIIDGGISPVIASGRADFVLGLEPMETVRALPFMSARTVVYMNTTPVIPYVLGQRAAAKEEDARYPDLQDLADHVREVTPHVHLVEAGALAAKAGSAKTMNIVMLGCFLSGKAIPYPPDDFWERIAADMPARLRETNRKAFLGGVEFGMGVQLCEDRQ